MPTSFVWFCHFIEEKLEGQRGTMTLIPNQSPWHWSASFLLKKCHSHPIPLLLLHAPLNGLQASLTDTQTAQTESEGNLRPGT